MVSVLTRSLCRSKPMLVGEMVWEEVLRSLKGEGGQTGTERVHESQGTLGCSTVRRGLSSAQYGQYGSSFGNGYHQQGRGGGDFGGGGALRIF